MKKSGYLLLLGLSLVLLVGACAPVPESPDVEAELRATLVAMNVEQTLQAQQIETLQSQLAEPTATCPVCTTETQETPAASATPVPPTATLTPTSQPTGSISGKLGYPSSQIPPQRIVAINTVTGHYWWQNAVTNQTTYRFEELPVGNYYVMAYLIENPSRDHYAGYSVFVTCGLSVGCSDHSLISVEIKAGQETGGIDPIDWYTSDPEALGWPLDPTINWN
ncbi:MAG: hypothetical protein GX797_06065 [Chloroflexi bacterium]|jgi:hypothetical protein|nr:hypothetical protein [Chloroflexota bacterium]